MIEYNSLDDVGQGYDLLQYEDNKIAYTLGRHTNDYMTSFYSITPSGFFIENGWGGRIIDPKTWKPIETFEGPSFWGHERLFLQDVRKLCDEKGILLIYDEIQAGLGRTGKMWAHEHWNTAPDILCLAKGIAGGVPMGATLVKPEILDCISKGEHSSTFGGNPLSCAAGVATMQALTQDKLVENSANMGKLFRQGLDKLKEKHPVIREIRGKGLMIGVELKFEVRDILMEGIEKGLLLLYSGRNILRLLPPLVITEADVTKSLEILDELFTNEEKRKNAQR